MDWTFLALVVLGVFSIVSGKICEVPSGNANLITSLNKKLLRSVEDESEEPNPSVYLGLRLSSTHSLSLELEYLAKLQTTLVPSLKSSLSEHKPQPITGLLALQALALRAACADPITATLNDKTVLQHLKQQLHHEKEHIANSNRPLTNYYQYSLGVLSLCVNGVRLNPHVIHKLTEAQKHSAFLHKDSASVDTEAMAGLAFQCLKDSAELYDARLNEHVQHALGAVKAELVKAQDEKGLIGNVFSTPLAVQALLAMNSAASQCSTAVETLVTEMSLGTFHNPMAISQLLPVLHQKTYLDISKMDCTGEDDSLVLEPRPPAGDLPPEKVMVRVVVKSSEVGPAIYTGRVRVPKGSSLHDALKEMQRQKPQEFTFETVDSLWGPYLTTVLGVMTQQANQTYWQLIKSPDTPLIEGIADYKIEHGDTFILRKSKW
ncbi:transcobalamin-2-like [Acipenser ruthenus]|uniref:transcobalamin-2-like n=1 Tax=Acipenser ruthenus TaxID=7906 RepID=UPI0027415AB3|nr:transcobalamin-2-like [Acipenser ruthenus]XP_058850762.1 transcobalamin-2-like [Acipenser ruthenus]